MRKSETFPAVGGPIRIPGQAGNLLSRRSRLHVDTSGISSLIRPAEERTEPVIPGGSTERFRTPSEVVEGLPIGADARRELESRLREWGKAENVLIFRKSLFRALIEMAPRDYVLRSEIARRALSLYRETRGESLRRDRGERLVLQKSSGGPFIGPRGGKWADAEHTIPWKEEEHAPSSAKKNRYSEEEAISEMEAIGDRLHAHQAMDPRSRDATGFNSFDMTLWHRARGNADAMRRILAKYRRQIGEEEYTLMGLADQRATGAPQIKPTLHPRWGSLRLPLAGRIERGAKWDAYLGANRFLKEKGLVRFDGDTKTWFIPQEKIASLTPEIWDEFSKKMEAAGVVVGALPEFAAPKKAEAGKPVAPEEPAAPPPPPRELSGITEYDPETHARKTFDLNLVEEAIEKLRVLLPDWKIVTEGVKEAAVERSARDAELRLPIPEVAEKIAPGAALFPYQNEAVRFLIEHDGKALIGDEMGLGKTLQSLAYGAATGKRMLVVVPKVVRRTWIKEAERFFPDYFKGHTRELISAELRRDGMPDLSDVKIAAVNYESLEKFMPAILAAGFDTIVVDESHRIKSPKAKITKTISALRDKFPHRILLSGTAVKNKKDELHTQIEFIQPGLFGKRELQFGTIGGVWNKLKRSVYIARQKKTVLPDLPEKTTQITEHKVSGMPAFPKDIGEMSRARVDAALAKAPVTAEFVKEILESSDSSVLVFSESKEAAEKIAKELGEVAILHHGQMSDDKREGAKEEFQREGTPKRVFVSTRQSLAVGATLTAADKVIFNDIPWTAADLRQAEDRAHRVGQRNNVNIYWMTAQDSDWDKTASAILLRKYELNRKINEGKQLTEQERKWMGEPVKLEEIRGELTGGKAGPVVGHTSPDPKQVENQVEQLAGAVEKESARGAGPQGNQVWFDWLKVHGKGEDTFSRIESLGGYSKARAKFKEHVAGATSAEVAPPPAEVAPVEAAPPKPPEQPTETQTTIRRPAVQLDLFGKAITDSDLARLRPRLMMRPGIVPLELVWMAEEVPDELHTRPLGALGGEGSPFSKAAPEKPPGAGWEAIPGSMHGGFRRPVGTGAVRAWEYWYPHGGKQLGMLGEPDARNLTGVPVAPAPAPAPKQKQLVLFKAASHRYIKRVPSASPPPKYRYFYKLSGKRGITGSEDLAEGAKFKVEHQGRAGHFEVRHHDKAQGMVTVRHDESGKTVHLREKDLHRMIAAQHGRKTERTAAERKAKHDEKAPPPMKLRVQPTQAKLPGTGATEQKFPEPRAPEKPAPKLPRASLADLGKGGFDNIEGFSMDAADLEKQAAAMKSDREFAIIPQANGFVLASKMKTAKGASKAVGDATSVYMRGGKQNIQAMPGEYVVMEAGDIIASHDPESFTPREEYPEGVQERRYHEVEAEREKIDRIARDLEPAITVNTNPDAINGAPVVTEHGIVLGGNGRTMGMQRAYAVYPEKAAALKAYLGQHARAFGLSSAQIEGMKQPILVRRVQAGTDTQKLTALGRRMNEALTQGLDPRSAEVALGKNYVNKDLVDTLTHDMDPEETLSKFLVNSRSRNFVSALMRSGIIDQYNVAEFIDEKSGLLNEDGRSRVERVMAARMIPDASVLSQMDQNLRASIAQAVPYFLRAESSGWDLRESLRRAIDADIDMRHRNMRPNAKDRRSYLAQTENVSGATSAVQKDPVADALLEAIQDHKGVNKFSGAIRQVAVDAHRQNANTGMALPGLEIPKKSKAESILEAFGLERETKQQGLALSSNFPITLRKAEVSAESLGKYLMDAVLYELERLMRGGVLVASAQGKGIDSQHILKRIKAFIAEQSKRDRNFARALGAHPLTDETLRGLIAAYAKAHVSEIAKALAHASLWQGLQKAGEAHAG